MQMTEDQPVNIITPSLPDRGCPNTIESDTDLENLTLKIPCAEIVEITNDNELISRIQNQKHLKNIKNFNRHKSNLQKK